METEGAKVYYEIYGEGETTVFLLPTWQIVHARNWKAQIPYLSRHYRVITSDHLGSGKSDRPEELQAECERILDKFQDQLDEKAIPSAGPRTGTL